MRGTNGAPKNSHTKHIYALAEGMGHDEDPLQLSDISRMPTFPVPLFSLNFLFPLAIHKLARLENYRVYIEALLPLKLERVRKNILTRLYIKTELLLSVNSRTSNQPPLVI